MPATVVGAVPLEPVRARVVPAGRAGVLDAPAPDTLAPGGGVVAATRVVGASVVSVVATGSVVVVAGASVVVVSGTVVVVGQTVGIGGVGQGAATAAFAFGLHGSTLPAPTGPPVGASREAMPNKMMRHGPRVLAFMGGIALSGMTVGECGRFLSGGRR